MKHTWHEVNKIEIDKHRDTILEALQDYKRWFCDGVSESDNERVKEIDNAINFMEKA